MAIRQLIASKDTHICHVNTDDNSPTYEAATEYARGTVVQYRGVAYAAIVDISDEDTDTPDIAPLKWGIVPDAAGLAADGELSNLESRVTALEGDVEDINDTLENKYLLTQRLTSIQIKADGVKTVKDCLDELSGALLTAAAAIADEQFIEPLVLFCGGYAWMGAVGFNYLTNTSTSFNVPFARSVISGGALYHFVASFADADLNANALSRTLIESTPAVTITDVLTDVPAANTAFEVQYRVWTKVSA